MGKNNETKASLVKVAVGATMAVAGTILCNKGLKELGKKIAKS